MKSQVVLTEEAVASPKRFGGGVVLLGRVAILVLALVALGWWADPGEQDWPWSGGEATAGK